MPEPVNSNPTETITTSVTVTSSATPKTSDEYDAFESFARKLVQVPKHAIDEADAARR